MALAIRQGFICLGRNRANIAVFCRSYRVGADDPHKMPNVDRVAWI